MVTLNNQLICAADHHDDLQSHMVHILKVTLVGPSPPTVSAVFGLT